MQATGRVNGADQMTSGRQTYKKEEGFQMSLIVSILDYGAKADGTLQTSRIQRAIDDCFLRGGGEVRIPAGVFFTGGIRLRTGVTLHLLKDAVLKGSRDPEDYFGYRSDTVEPIPAELITDAPCVACAGGETAYDAGRREYDFKRLPGSRWLNALVRALHAENIAIVGEEGSALDGSNCYDAQGEEGYRGPHCIEMFGCRNITLTGYTVRDSANWAHSLYYCDNVSVSRITVLAGHDGLDVAECRNVRIEDSGFYTGDDCIAGFANLNVWVSGCELNSACSAFRFGGTNVMIEGCHIYGPGRYSFRGSLTEEEKRRGAPSSTAGHRSNMLSAFTYFADYSLPIAQKPGNIVMTGCKIENADRLLHYNYSGNETWQKNRPLGNIRFAQIDATGIGMPLTAYGDAKEPVTVEFEDVRVAFRPEARKVSFMHACNYRRISLRNVTVTGNNAAPLIKTWSDGKVEIDSLACGVGPDDYVGRAEEVFACTPI